MSSGGLTRRDFLKGLTAAAAGGLVGGLPRFPFGSVPPSPDVILFIADQHRYDALGCADGSYYTPNLDLFAGEGVRFTNAFCASPLCAPSRASMMTGLYPHQHGVRRNGKDLDTEMWTLAKEFRRLGYDTAHFGKWHLGSGPGPHGFDFHRRYRKDITEEVVDFLADRDRSRPLFLVVSWRLPHPPYELIEDYAPLIPRDSVSLPPSYRDRLEDRPRWYSAIAVEKDLTVGIKDPVQAHQIARRYRTMVAEVDRRFGEVTARLRDLGMYDGAVIAYTSDHGELMGAHRLAGKNVAFDESIRVPLLLRAPGAVPVRRVVDDLVSTVSLAGTLLAAAGFPLPAELAGGESWSRVFRAEAPADQAVFFEHYRYRAVRTTWGKLVDHYEGLGEYNDLASDPLEMVNFIRDPARRTSRAYLRRELDAWWTATGETWPRRRKP